MKIQINTENKIIKIEEKVNLLELYNILNKMFPNDEWHQYDLETNININDWKNPIPWYPPITPIPLTPHPWLDYPTYIGDPLPNQQPIITCGTGGLTSAKMNITNGIYNVDVKY